MTAQSHPRGQPRPIRTVGIIAKTRLPEAASVVGDIVRWLSTRGLETVMEAETAARVGHSDTSVCAAAELPTRADLLLVLGGDGTLLGVAREVAGSDTDVPILAVNFGSLGFLTEVTLPELYGSLQSVIDGAAGIDQRQMLQAQVHRGEEILADRLVLNDVVIGKAALSNILELEVTVGETCPTQASIASSALTRFITCPIPTPRSASSAGFCDRVESPGSSSRGRGTPTIRSPSSRCASTASSRTTSMCTPSGGRHRRAGSPT